MKTINNKLKELRLRKGLKQEEVAILLSLQCTNRICRWEHGVSVPSVQNLFKLAKIYEVLPHAIYPDLFPENDHNTPLEESLLIHTYPQENGDIQ